MHKHLIKFLLLMSVFFGEACAENMHVQHHYQPHLNGSKSSFFSQGGGGELVLPEEVRHRGFFFNPKVTLNFGRSKLCDSNVCLLPALPLSLPRFNATVIQVVLLAGVVHKLPIVAPIFLKGSRGVKLPD